VTSPIQRRVAALEAFASDGGKCPRCGWGGGDGDFGPHDTYELVWVDPDGPDDREEFCEACDRQLVYVLTWGDDS
jgi:hypothetical protein